MVEKEIRQEDLFIAYDEFEAINKITEDREDIPKRFLGLCPSKYYKTMDMNVEKLRSVVDNMFQRFLLRNPH